MSGPATEPRSARRGFALRPTLASRSLRPCGPAFASHTGGAGGANRALRPGVTLGARGTALTSQAGGAGGAGGTNRALRPGVTLLARRATLASSSALAGGPLRTHRPLRAGGANGPGRALRAGRARDASGTSWPLRACGSLWTGAAQAAHDDAGQEGCHKSNNNGPTKGIGGHPLLESFHGSLGRFEARE